jgi:serine/threonine-protein kinase RsbT
MTPLKVELKVSADLLQARLAARAMAEKAGLGVMDQTRFATAVSELSRNALVYAGGGWCELTDRSNAAEVRLHAEIHDLGPGIADIQQAMGDGYSTGGSLGAGLPGTRRLVDQFDIQSSSNGTHVQVEIVRRRRVT